MIKGTSAHIPFKLYASGSYAGATGKTPITRISKDGGNLTVTTHTAVELSSAVAPGMYTVELTDAEMNADVILLIASASDCEQSTIKITTDDITVLKDYGDSNWRTATGFSSDEAVTSISTEIAGIREDVENLPTEVATTVLSENCGDLDVALNGYTLTHLIMASQKSSTATTGVSAQWTIKNAAGDTIATRNLTLNSKGAITGTD